MNSASRSSVTQLTAREYKQRVCQAMNFISQNLHRDLTLDEIAAAAWFSKFHFHRIFKAMVGETIAQFTRRLRLELAANHLVLRPDDDITKIALDCGFSSSQNFAKAFRQHFSTTPTEFRNSKTGNKVSKGENDLSLQFSYDSDSAFANSNLEERNKTMNAEVKDMPEYKVAYVRKLGAYGKETCEQAFGELMQWAGPHGYVESGIMLGVYWDNPEVTPPEKCRVDACVSVPDGTVPEAPVGTQTISGGPYAVCRFETEADGFSECWDAAFEWLVANGYECEDRPCYELYHNSPEDHPENKWVFDICIPLKK